MRKASIGKTRKTSTKDSTSRTREKAGIFQKPTMVA